MCHAMIPQLPMKNNNIHGFIPDTLVCDVYYSEVMWATLFEYRTGEMGLYFEIKF